MSNNPLADHIDEATDEEMEAGVEELLKELEYLRYFYREADFGPGHSDVMYIINEHYEGEIPEGYRPEEEDDE